MFDPFSSGGGGESAGDASGVFSSGGGDGGWRWRHSILCNDDSLPARCCWPGRRFFSSSPAADTSASGSSKKKKKKEKRGTRPVGARQISAAVGWTICLVSISKCLASSPPAAPRRQPMCLAVMRAGCWTFSAVAGALRGIQDLPSIRQSTSCLVIVLLRALQ